LKDPGQQYPFRGAVHDLVRRNDLPVPGGNAVFQPEKLDFDPERARSEISEHGIALFQALFPLLK
jgi:hypothetical protein